MARALGLQLPSPTFSRVQPAVSPDSWPLPLPCTEERGPDEGPGSPAMHSTDGELSGASHSLPSKAGHHFPTAQALFLGWHLWVAASTILGASDPHCPPALGRMREKGRKSGRSKSFAERLTGSVPSSHPTQVPGNAPSAPASWWEWESLQECSTGSLVRRRGHST